ncbi:MAG: tetratricopeptide repeat protein, partial [Okeania sp. SIO2D1]|nr:tetratricopeptide repeat protein [Okeania sp. SIO2D1]
MHIYQPNNGDRALNLENAIAAYNLALSVRTQKDFPMDWAETQNNLGHAYCERISGDRALNLENAISAYNLAMETFLQQLSQRLQLNQLISQHLSGIKELIIVPHLALHQIPFAALPMDI